MSGKPGKSCKLIVVLAIALVSSTIRIAPVVAQEEYKSGAWLKITHVFPPEWTLMPMVPGWWYVGWELFGDPLAIRLMNGTLIPRLATDWEFDPLTSNFTLHLRQGVLWHDGETEFQSEDVLTRWTAYSMYYYEPQPAIPPAIDKIYTPDEYTVVFHFARVYPGFMEDVLEQLVGGLWMRNGPLYKFGNETVRKWLDDKNTEELTKLKDQYTALSRIKDPSLYLGTGPFKMTRITDEIIVFEKWSRHWLADNVKYKGVIIYPSKTQDAAMMMFLYGDVDLVAIEGMEVLRTALSKPEVFTVRRGSYEWIDGVLLNSRAYPLSVKEVRHALAYAIDPAVACEYMGYGAAPLPQRGIILFPAQVNYWLTPDFIAKLREYPYDIDEANKLLDDLGFIDRDGDGTRETPNGTKLEFSMPTVAEWTAGALAADYLASQWSKIGVKANIVGMPFQAYSLELTKMEYPAFAFNEPYFRYPHTGFDSLFRIMSGWSPEPVKKPFYEEIVDVPEWVDPKAGTANITRLVLDLSTTVDPAEYKRIVRILVWYENEYVHFIPWGTYGRFFGINIQRMKGMENVPDYDPRLFFPKAAIVYFLATTGVIEPILKLTVSAVGGGTTNPPAGTYTHTMNNTVTVTATGSSGFTFDHWELDGKIVSRETSYAVLMDEDHMLTPVFAELAAPPLGLYAAMGILAVLMIVGWIVAFMWRRRTRS